MLPGRSKTKTPKLSKPMPFPRELPGLWTVFPDTPDGYERITPGPPDLMLPVGSTRTLTIGTPGRGPLVVEDLDNSGLIGPQGNCRVRLLDKMLVLEGRQPGSIWITLQQDGRSLDIHVSVKVQVEIPIVAHFVEHGPHLKTRMTHTTLLETIGSANRILMPQANATVVLDEERDLTYAMTGKRLGRTVTEIHGNTEDEWADVTKHKKPPPPDKPRLLNLFLVRRFESIDEDKPGREVAATGDGCCIFEDRFTFGKFEAAAAGSTLAHEIGHHFKLDHVNDQRRLMYELQPRRDRLTRSEADRINPTGTTLDPF